MLQKTEDGITSALGFRTPLIAAFSYCTPSLTVNVPYDQDAGYDESDFWIIEVLKAFRPMCVSSQYPTIPVPLYNTRKGSSMCPFTSDLAVID